MFSLGIFLLSFIAASGEPATRIGAEPQTGLEVGHSKELVIYDQTNAKINAELFQFTLGLGKTGYGRSIANYQSVLQCTTDPVVTSNSNSGPGTLRQAVIDACAGSVITFSACASSPILLSTGQININKNLTIAGPGANLMTVQNTAAPSSTSRVFIIPSGVTVSISGITVTGGHTAGGGGVGDGGGIRNFGTLNVNECVISGNFATGNGGGGIANQGTLNVTDTTVSNNTSTFSGGGLEMINGGTMVVLRSTISGNVSPGGGGIGAQSLGSPNCSLTVLNSTISGNTATVDSGAIGNFSQGGGSSIVTIANSTITNNSVPNHGSAFANGVNSVGSIASITILNSIVANNPGAAQFYKYGGATTTSLGYNIFSDAVVTPTTGDQINTNPMLAPLAFNGGLTQTHAFSSATSPAIDKGNNAGSGVTTDQRGLPRPTDISGLTNTADGSDIGAYELQNADTVPTILSAGIITRQPGTAGLNSVVATVSDNESAAGSLKVTALTVPDGFSISNILNANGTITATVEVCCGTALGNHTIVLQVTDGELTATADLTVDVGVNTPPSLAYNMPAPIVFGQSTTVTPNSPPTDNGSVASVSIQSSGTFTGTVSVNAAGVVSIANANVGTHTIVVRATDNCGIFTDASFQLSVGKADTTAIITADDPDPSVYGQLVTVHFTVTAKSPGNGTPTGTAVVSLSGSGDTCSALVSVGICTLTLTKTGAGTLVLSYPGDANFNSGNTTGTHQVDKAATTTTITNSLASNTNIGQFYPVNWGVQPVSPGTGTPTGTVTVSDGTGGQCSAPVSAGTCNMPSLTVGTKSVTATYGGDVNFLESSTSQTIQHTVGLTISGNIRQALLNTNMSGVEVVLTGTGGPITTTTDANGNYFFTGVFTGNYGVTPTPGGGVTFDPVSRSVINVLDNTNGIDFLGYSPVVPRVMSIPTTYATPGQAADVMVNVSTLGNEKTFAFTLFYDANLLSSPTPVCGTSDAGCAVSQTTSPGTIAVTVTPASQLPAGDRNIVRVRFQTFTSEPANTIVGVATNSQTALDSSGNPLSIYVGDIGYVVFAIGVEGDVWNKATNSPGSDGKVTAEDSVYEAKLVSNPSLIDNSKVNEFQRADTSDAGSKGNGVFNVADLVQTINYQTGLNGGNQVVVGGPMQPLPTPTPLSRADEVERSEGRTLRIVSTTAVKGGDALVSIELDPKGDEVATSFSLNFDASKLSVSDQNGPNNPDIVLGSGAPVGTSMIVNAAEAEKGRIGIVIFNPTMIPFVKDGTPKQVVNIRFHVGKDARAGQTAVTFEDADPTPLSTSDTLAQTLASAYINGEVTIGGQASTTGAISGRVLSPEGMGLRNAVVTLTDSNGVKRTAITATAGFYRFDSVAIGESYEISVSSKKYRFTRRSIQAADDLANVNFSGTD